MNTNNNAGIEQMMRHRAMRIVELEEELREAKSVISTLVRPPSRCTDADNDRWREYCEAALAYAETGILIWDHI